MLPKLKLWYERHKILSWVISGIIVLYTVAGFIVAPLVIDYTLRNKISQQVQRKVQADSVRVNPYTFSLRLTGLSIADPRTGWLLQVGDLFANADPLISLFKWGVVIKSVEITRPKVQIERADDGRFNFDDLLPTQEKTAKASEAEPAKPVRLIVKGFTLTDGEVRFSDQFLPNSFDSTLSSVRVELERLDTQPEADAAVYRIFARSESDEELEVTGGIDVDPFDISAAIKLAGVALAKYAPYQRSLFEATVAEGRLGIQADVAWSENIQRVDNLKLRISRLDLVSSPDKPLVTIPEFQIVGASIDLAKQAVQLGTVTTSDGRINVRLDGQGKLNLQEAFTPPQPAKPKMAQTTPGKTTSEKQTWVVEMPTFGLKNYTVTYRDQQTQPEADVTLHQIHVDAKGLSSQKDAKGTVAVKFNWAQQGTLAVEGDAGLVPLQADMALKVQEMDIRPLQPYINQHLQLVVTKGLLATEGRLKLNPGQAEGMDLEFAGQVAMTQFKSVDKQKAAAFLDWKSLYLNGVAFSTVPFKLNVNEVALTDFYKRLIIRQDGRSNLGMMMRPVVTAAAKNPTTATPSQKTGQTTGGTNEPSIKIKSVTLQGGKVDFSDLSVKPNVRLPMAKIGGRISGLDNIQTHKADVLLKGMVGGNVPLEIKGQVNPLIEKPFVDITIGLKGVDLSPITPYSGKYLGYKLAKGQLSLDLAYQVAENKLAGQNKVQLNQLTLGESVQSPTATKLPIKLALALLKDRHGNIDLDLPVAGELDDPEFSIGGIVVKMFVNLIVGIISSPFKMLGALVGGGEELAFLDFDSGQSGVSDEKKEKLDALAKILFERPGLKLEIQGQVHPEEDIDGLRRMRFEDQLKAAKLKKMVARGTTAVPLEQIVLAAEERNGLVQNAYKAAKFPKPRDEKGKVKKLSAVEMEKLLYTAIEITEDDLRLLAHQRASAAKDYLAGQGKVEVERLFIVEPELGGGETEDLHRRVKFNFT